MAGKHRAPTPPSNVGRVTVVGGAMVGLLSPMAADAVTPPEPQPVTSDVLGIIPSQRALPSTAAQLPEESSSVGKTRTIVLDAPPVEQAKTYEVVDGDCLSEIADRFGILTSDLYLANRDVVGDHPDLIFPGQVLALSGSVSTGSHVNTGPQHAAPIQSPVTGYQITSGFGPRGAEFHRGVDIGTPVGTPAYAVADGVVFMARPAQGFGLWTIIRSQIDGQTVDFVYGHEDHLTLAEGDHVNVGDHVIDTGSNGIVTGPHLHFEVWVGGRINGHAVDPVAWLADHGVTLS